MKIKLEKKLRYAGELHEKGAIVDIIDDKINLLENKLTNLKDKGYYLEKIKIKKK